MITKTNRTGFRFVDHPWISFPVFLVFIILSMVLSGIFIFGFLKFSQDAPFSQFVQSSLGHVLMLFVFVPFVLRLPKGKTTYREYLDDIRLTKIQPFFRLLFIAISCYIILLFCQVLGSFIFRLSEGKAITLEFIRSVLDITNELPPRSWSLLTSLPSMFEEIAFRGVLLTFFLVKYSKRKSIVFSSLGFGIIHFFNILSGRDPVWVTGQVIWAFILGLFYGYLFIKTGSLLPVMLFHYFGNLFVYSLTGYIQETASVAIQVLYGVTFAFGLIPVILMILWIRFFSARWPFEGESKITKMVTISTITA